MKIYTLIEYENHYGTHDRKNYHIPHSWMCSFKGVQRCTCLRGFGPWPNSHALENCFNCLGHGYSPIPWSEVINV